MPAMQSVTRLPTAAKILPATMAAPAYRPNDLDRIRIERALRDRKRYRYVTPVVYAMEDGYRIDSPCCSRNIDRDGGVIAVAQLLFDADARRWQIFRHDHATKTWQLHGKSPQLSTLLAVLSEDAAREFWP